MQFIKFWAWLVLSLAMWASIFGIAGYAFLSVAPCHWFGTSFEGACGYAGASFTVLVCVTLSLIMSVVTATKMMRRQSPTRE